MNGTDAGGAYRAGWILCVLEPSLFVAMASTTSTTRELAPMISAIRQAAKYLAQVPTPTRRMQQTTRIARSSRTPQEQLFGPNIAPKIMILVAETDLPGQVHQVRHVFPTLYVQVLPNSGMVEAYANGGVLGGLLRRFSALARPARPRLQTQTSHGRIGSRFSTTTTPPTTWLPVPN